MTITVQVEPTAQAPCKFEVVVSSLISSRLKSSVTLTLLFILLPIFSSYCFIQYIWMKYYSQFIFVYKKEIN